MKTTETKTRREPGKRTFLSFPSKLKLAALSAGCLTAGAAALYTEIMTTAVARRKSKAMDVLVSKALADVSTEQQTRDESIRTMDSLPAEDVSIKSRDGLSLKGHWVHANDPKRLVIMAHGWH